MAIDRPFTGPNVTIDSNLGAVPALAADRVPALLEALAPSPEDRRRILALVARFEAETQGPQSRAQFASILQEFRDVSRSAYEHIGKPLFLTFVRRTGGSLR